MAGKKQPTPIEVFEANISDAERLLDFTRALTNGRKYGMRRELRESIGGALRLKKAKRDKLDCVESDEVFVLLKPGGRVTRANFTEPELRPLLRQAIVATAAAVESYVVEKACSRCSDALDSPPPRLKEVGMSLADVIDIETRYKRRRWGHRAILEAHIEAEASSDPARIGKVFSTVGLKGFWREVDSQRGVAKGRSEEQLSSLAKRRNKIAHTGDRTPTGRSTLSLDEVETHYKNAKEIVEALEAVL
jgi:RiboL-PSP-HEPN